MVACQHMLYNDSYVIVACVAPSREYNTICAEFAWCLECSSSASFSDVNVTAGLFAVLCCCMTN